MNVLLQQKSTTVSWFTLFYDLVVVAAFSETAHVYAQDPTWSTLLYVALAVLTLYNQWGLTTLEFLVDQQDTWPRRIVVLIQMCAILLAAVSLGHGSSLAHDWGFYALAVSFAASATLTVLRSRDVGVDRRHVRSLSVALYVSAAVYLVGGFMKNGVILPDFRAEFGVFVVGLAISTLAAIIWAPRLVTTHSSVNQEQLQERFGLLLLIVLGESFLLLVSSLAGKGMIPSPLFFVLTVVAVFTIWVLYFPNLAGNLGAPSTRHARGIIGAHYFLILSSANIIVAFVSLAGGASHPGPVNLETSWTALPFFGVLSSILWLTLIRDGRWSRTATMHVVALLVLLGLSVGGAFVDRITDDYLLVAGLVVLMLDATFTLRFTFRRNSAPHLSRK